MWLLPLPLGAEQRIRLPIERHLLPWHLDAGETERLADLLSGVLVGVERHLVLPWPAARSLGSLGGVPQMHGTLLVVTLEEPAPPVEELDEVLGRFSCTHAMLRYARPQENGYGWQERYLKPAIVNLLHEQIADERHPLAAFNVAALPVRPAASLAAEVLGLLDLLDGTLNHRLARIEEGTSAADYEASLYGVAGQRIANRLNRLPVYERDAAIEVLAGGAVGSWNEERFRIGARALEDVGLARVAGGSVSLDPLARRAKDARIRVAWEGLRSRMPAAPEVRRWTLETPDVPAGRLDIVRKWVRDGSDFKERCRRAEDVLTDPDRGRALELEKSAEYDLWLDAIRSQFSEEEWEQINVIHMSDAEYDETEEEASAWRAAAHPAEPRTTFRGFQILDPKRFGSQDSLPRQIDAFLVRRRDLKPDLAKWMAFALDRDLRGHGKSLFVDMVSWIWRSLVEDPADRKAARGEAHEVLRRCYALTLKNSYEHQRKRIEEDAGAIGLDVSGVTAAGDRPKEFLDKMKEGFEKMLDGAYREARQAYEQAVSIARQRSDSFDEWVAFHGEEDAVLASLSAGSAAREESRNLRDDYRRRREAMEKSPRVAEWLEGVRVRREKLGEMAIEGYIRENRKRTTIGRSMSFSSHPHDYWTMFRDLETIPAPPNLQAVYIRPLIDLGGFDPDDGFDPEGELHYRLQLGIDKTEKTEDWLTRIIDMPRASLHDARVRHELLLKEFTRADTFKRERLRRLAVLPSISDILRTQDLSWGRSFLAQHGKDASEGTGLHRGYDHNYVRALCAYADLLTEPAAVLELLEALAFDPSLGHFERHQLAKRLGHALPLEQWSGLDVGAAGRLLRLVLALVGASKGDDRLSSSEDLAWALFFIFRGARRFSRAFPADLTDEARLWALALLQKKRPADESDPHTVIAATHLAYLLAADDPAREEIVKLALALAEDQPGEAGQGFTLDGPMGAWVSLAEAGTDPTSAPLIEAATTLWARLDARWDESMRIAKDNPHLTWPYIAFLARWIASGKAAPLACERLLVLVQAAPQHISLCAEVLDPAFWTDQWPVFLDLVWRYASGADAADPVAARLGAVDLYRRWANAHTRTPSDLPPDLGFLLDAALLAIHDESPSIANHAAYAIAGHAALARAPFDVRRLAGGLRRLATDPRVAVRGAAAYAGKKLPMMDVGDEIRAVALQIDAELASDPYALVQRQRAFGELDGKFPPL